MAAPQQDELDAADALARLRAIAETVPDAMIGIDERGVMDSFSTQAELMFGWTAAEAIGRNVTLLMPEPHAARHDTYIERYMRTGEARIIGQRRALLGRRKDGTTFPIELSVGEARIGERRVFIGFVHDVSREQRSERRAADLEAELIHVSRLSAMGQMASTVAHELNQPLGAAEIFAAAALRRLPPDPTGDLAKAAAAIVQCGEQVKRAGQILKRLREFASRRQSERKPESLRKVMDEAMALALIGAGSENLEIAIVNTAPASVLIDRIQIQQVVVNLIRNAMEAMAGLAAKRLDVALTTTADGEAQISIADNGPGFDAGVRHDLFTPFVTTKRDGLGIGLSICRTIVEAHGGFIWAEKRPEGGAVFSFTLPRAPDGEAAA
ncbi:MAG: PAS domain S-box protein [Alphaproteobacteria bacterium]|nr:PAS domain S-box protein [Alphaproteobacteria bacterium]